MCLYFTAKGSSDKRKDLHKAITHCDLSPQTSTTYEWKGTQLENAPGLQPLRLLVNAPNVKLPHLTPYHCN